MLKRVLFPVVALLLSVLDWGPRPHDARGTRRSVVLKDVLDRER